jgi:hypothetical protein
LSALLVGVDVAQADPRFTVAEREARAADVVHFSITNVDDDLTYVVEVDDRVVASGASDDEDVSGQFGMPDLGAKARSVTVEAQVNEDGDRDTFTRRIEYLGPAPAPKPAATVVPASPSVSAAPAPAPGPASVPAAVAPAQAPNAAPRPGAKRRTARKRAARRRTRTRVRKGAPAPRATVRRAKTLRRRESGGVRVRRNRVLHDAPLFRGVPEGPGGGSESTASGTPGIASVTAIAPPHVLAASASATDSPWPKPADAVPLALGVVALLLAGTVLARRRRLGADPEGQDQAGT